MDLIYRIAICSPKDTYPVASRMFQHTQAAGCPSGTIVAPAYHMTVRMGRSRTRKKVVRFVLPGFVFVAESEAEGLIESLWGKDDAPVSWLRRPGENSDRPYCVCSDTELEPISEFARFRQAKGPYYHLKETRAASESSQHASPQFPPGHRVKVTQGPFSGWLGVVARSGSKGSGDPLYHVEIPQFSIKIRCSPFFLESTEL